MATQILTTPFGVYDTTLPNHTPADPIAFAIAQHRRAYAAVLATRERSWALHELFDPQHEMEQHDEIREALTTIHGPHAPEEIATYFAADAAANAAGWDEDEAWTRFTALVPGSGQELAMWLDYTIEHADKQDTGVTLQRALRHVAAMLGDRLAA
ncbi:hypothetical protein [Lichenifustis flavocetrariae]|uniref:Uncharacterized protein n=1 Tax=Lichenifustis flavocetrariae TaxID=2949735 RepID=A0AA41YTL2_9HYPH|nr:hypothetical protein [Lichenifustis flavocetrariae]MCW6506986.1 hypothetical protein [Lichenifustis flavocetrariae]